MLPMAEQTVSKLLAAALRSQCLSLAKACSIGFRSGEYFGRKNSLAPTMRIGSRTGLATMTAKVIHNDNVAGAKCWNQHLFDIEPKPFAVDRTVKHARRLDPIAAKRGEECHRLPMTMRSLGSQSAPAPRPAPQG